MMRLKSLSLTLGLLAAPLSPAGAHDHAHMMNMEAAQPVSGASIYNLASRWTDQDGKTVDLKSLSGRPLVAAMAYTSCKDICPLIVANMVAIEKAAQAKNLHAVRYIFFSLDSALDTPARLKAYAEERGLDPQDWTLFNGDAKAVRDLAAVLGVRYRRDDQGGFDHASVISLLNDKGEIVFQKLDATLDTGEFVGKIEALDQPTK
jgi:protein SCO1/2